MIKLRRLVAVGIGLVLVCGGSRLTATETFFVGVPVYSVMSTVDTYLSLPPLGASVFTPLNIPCPAAAGAKGCTIRVTVTAWVSGANPHASIQVTTAPLYTPFPQGPISFTEANAGAFDAPLAMQWVFKNVPAGSAPEVDVTGVSTPIIALGPRTLSIDVFYGLL